MKTPDTKALPPGEHILYVLLNASLESAQTKKRRMSHVEVDFIVGMSEEEENPELAEKPTCANCGSTDLYEGTIDRASTLR